MCFLCLFVASPYFSKISNKKANLRGKFGALTVTELGCDKGGSENRISKEKSGWRKLRRRAAESKLADLSTRIPEEGRNRAS